MIKDQSVTQILTREIIQSGHQMFEKYLNQTVAKKNEKKRNRPNNNQHAERHLQYSSANLIKVQRVRLSSTHLLAQELLNANFSKQSDQQDQQDGLKYYEDFEAAQKLNNKIIKRFVRPVKKTIQKSIGWKENASPMDWFRKEAEDVIGGEVENELDRVDGRNRNRVKLEVKKEMMDHVDQAMLYLSSDLQVYHARKQFQNSLIEFNSSFIQNLCTTFKHNLTSDGLTTSYKPQTQTFTSMIQTLLPTYLQPSEYHLYTPLPWKTNHLQKELAKTSFQKITGKVLYKYEHNVLELKEHSFRGRMYEVEKREIGEIEKYLKENLEERRNTMIQEVQVKGAKIWKDSKNLSKKDEILRNNAASDKQRHQTKQFKHQSKDKQYIAQNLISHHFGMSKPNSKPSKIQIHDSVNPNTNKVVTIHQPNRTIANNNQPNRSKSYNSNAFQNFINIRTKAPQSSILAYNKRYDELDEYRYSKRDQFVDKQNIVEEKAIMKPKQPMMKPKQPARNIIFHQQVQSPPRRKRQPLDTRNSKALVDNQIYNIQSNEDDSEHESSSSEKSKFFDTMTRYKQKKTTKKKKSFLKKTPPQSSSFGEIKIKQSRNVVLSKKGQMINFYPLKIGNLILQRKNIAYLEYNSAKQELKNLTVKFLIDRIKHGIDKVQIVVPSFGHQNPATMKVNDQQKAKEIIKIISSLGGKVEKIKPRSGYDQKTSAHQQANRPKISTEIQIYKNFYKEMSYYEIIDALNLEKQWLESEKDNRKLGGWKY